MDKCYSLNDEEYNYTELGEVLDALEAEGMLEVGATYYEADSKRLTPERVLCAANVLEAADEALYDIVGEACDSPFYDSGDAARAELQELLNAWVAKHVDIDRYWEIVGKTRELKITAADLPANAV